MSHGYEGEIGSKKLADILGITEDQVDSYVTLDSNESDDGHPYGYYATFDRSTPEDVLEAAGVGDDFMIEIPLNAFDEEE